MGQNQSNEKSSGRGAAQADKDRKVHRKQSIHGLPTSSNHRSQPADASASTVAAQGTTTHSIDSATLDKMLQSSTSPELTSKQTGRVDRSTSRATKQQKHKEFETRNIPEESISPGPTGGIDIPASSTIHPSRSRHEELQDEGRTTSYDERAYAPVSHHRPPRFPLPIVEVGDVPDSPHLLPVDKNDADIIPLFDTDDQLHGPTSAGPLGRRSSMLSVATQDEEDVSEELQPIGMGYTGETVPTVIEWHAPAEKVFVTGTFAAWDKKYRLKKSDSQQDHWKTTINLPPGTHHLKFFVDNQMVTSPQLPTAVDFNNILVNYIEISTDDIPKSRRESSQPLPAGASKPIPTQAQPSPRLDEERKEEYSGVPTPGDEQEIAPSYIPEDSLPLEEIPEGDFRQITPQALIDIDITDDHDRRYQEAAEVIRDQPHPPTLPMFLSKSILNGNPSLKDDGSVLTLPNHTVLNHLMTSNVRNGVLATSVTTRYKKKYVTTISFKPVPKIQPRREASA